LFVWRGAIRVRGDANTYPAGERDTVFIQGPAEVEVKGEAPAELIEIAAP
jgi:hypothetical protein